MRIGFIGAGKVGVSIGKYLATEYEKRDQFNKPRITGYYSRSQESATWAATFTKSKIYQELDQLVKESDVLFLTVPDGIIKNIWDELRNLPIKGKLICHTSGSLSSTIFSGIESKGAFGYSIHPLYAISSKQESYQQLNQAVFTIEGNSTYITTVCQWFENLGNQVVTIDAEQKTKYHCAASMVSNEMVALCHIGQKLLCQCGFDKETAAKALGPLILGNAENIVKQGTVDALTGPVERNDVATVQGHLQVLDEKEKEIYCRLSEVLVEIAALRHPQSDYSKMKKELEKK